MILVFLLSFAVYAADRYIHFILVAISIHNNEAPGFGRKQISFKIYSSHIDLLKTPGLLSRKFKFI